MVSSRSSLLLSALVSLGPSLLCAGAEAVLCALLSNVV